ncbi:MAG: hypothetical protein HC809_03055 [Gammaproteobacteria bacterium]|nr:hypothetical protein [Gammaproteobacteria bacterium]
MPRYLFVYHGGSAPESEEEGRQAMAAWGDWFASMGKDVVDGGNPVGDSTTVKSDGSIMHSGGANPTTGYSVVDAKDLDDAIAKARGCPILGTGGSVEVAETFEP